MSELAPWPEQVREPPPRRLSGLRLIGRIAVVSTFAALVALLTILAKPLWQSERTPLNAGSQTSQASKPSDRLTANNAPANTTLVPAAGIAAAPGAAPSASAQQAPPAQAAASVALTELARTTEHLSRGNRQRSSVWDFRTIQRCGQGTWPEYEAGHRGCVQGGQRKWWGAGPAAPAHRGRRRLRARPDCRNNEAAL